MEVDRTEELQQSIDALLATIEAQKLALGSLLRDRGPLVVFSSWSAAAAPSGSLAGTRS